MSDIQQLLYLVGIPEQQDSWRRLPMGSDIDAENVIRSYWLLRFEAGDKEAADTSRWNDGAAKIIDVDLYDDSITDFPWLHPWMKIL